ncbi:MAG TPA: hypothetical protein VM029_22455 [Opitutaceae bacterium]|nr:hypothetical protein [Opitutaceae bacterium]
MNARWWLAVILVTALQAAEPEIELTGVIGSGREFQVALKTKDGAPRWVAVGKQFGGYTVESYDAKDDSVTLTQEGKRYRIGLRKSKVAHGTQEPPPQIQRALLNNLRQLAAASDQYYLEYGVKVVAYDQLVGPDKYVKRMEPIAGENYRAIEFAQGKPLTITTADGYSMSYNP